MVAGRGVTATFLVGTLVCTWIGSGSLFGGAGRAFRHDRRGCDRKSGHVSSPSTWQVPRGRDGPKARPRGPLLSATGTNASATLISCYNREVLMVREYMYFIDHVISGHYSYNLLQLAF